VLQNEHVATARRFRDFAMHHIGPAFFREEAARAHGPINRGDLVIALQQAYAIRSGYVHTLRGVPRQLSLRGFPEAIAVEGRPTLTFAGLSRVARHIIMQFVARGDTVEREEFDYRSSLPNIVTASLSPEYWIASDRGFTYEHGSSRLSAFIGQWNAAVLLRQSNAKVTDIRPVLAKIEETVPGLTRSSQRLPLLAMYFTFHHLLPPEQRMPKFAEMERFLADFNAPSVESFAAHAMTYQRPSWTLEQFEQLHKSYFKSRHRSNTVDLSRLLEAALSLQVAELNRVARNEPRARDLIAFATETHPGHTGLREFEASLIAGSLPEIVWQRILLPTQPLGSEQPAEPTPDKAA
jgi:hypothetical protein